MAESPLGNDPLFRRWDTARDVTGGQATFGATVIPHLVEGLGEFLAPPASRTPRNYRAHVALGVVPWLTNPDIVRLLSRMDGSCVVIDKGGNELRAARQLQTTGKPVPATWLNFDSLGVPGVDGAPPVIGPSGPMPGAEIELGPVRMAGYPHGKSRPLLHAKMLVLCHLDRLDYGEEWDGDYLKPVKAWVGSANWTTSAPNHLEFGMWTTDEPLVQACLDFTLDVLRFSEPLEPGTSAPTPELVEADWDDEAFREAITDIDGDVD